MPRDHSLRDRVIDAALALAAERGWRSLSLAEIAQRAGVGLGELVDAFPNRAAILDAYGRRVDARMLAGAGETGGPVRDRLFDALMRRFEAMAADRRALAAILRDLGGEPLTVACGVRRFGRSMALTLEAAGLPSSGFTGLLRIESLSVVAAYAFRAFLDDDADDLSHTMAALDSALRRAEGLAGLVWRRSAAAARHPSQ
jgi:AcrR family transcriptional regulator